MEQVFSRQASSRARGWRTARALAGVSVLVLAAAPSATSDDGLPPPTAETSLKGVVVSTGLGSATPAKQFFRVPRTLLWADSATFQTDGSLPQADVSAFAISPPGSPHPYGYFEPITIRTLAFGMIPAEATISLAQIRESVSDIDLDETAPDPNGPATEDVPVAWKMSGSAVEAGGQVLVGDVDVRITNLSLDGSPVQVGANCHTATPAFVRLVAHAGYLPVQGGKLSGTIDVPAFTGCGSKGEDLDPLITSMVSAAGNVLEISQSQIAVGRPLPVVEPRPFPLPER